MEQKRIPESDAALDLLIKNSAEDGGVSDRRRLRISGDKDRAFEWLERARQQRDAGLAGLREETYLNTSKTIRGGTQFLHKMGLADDSVKVITRCGVEALKR